MGLENKVFLRLLIAGVVVCTCVAQDYGSNSVDVKNDESIGSMIEEGRTMVHHAVKRFMILLPVIFFKLGVAFTLLVLVAIAAVNNGVIGFMLLVVGLSSVLARFQESSRRHAAPYYLPAPAVHHHVGYHDWDRSDKGVERIEKTTSYPAYNAQYVYNPLSAYTAASYGQKKI